MRMRKEIFVILYVFVFLVNDPHLVRACSFEKSSSATTVFQDANSEIYSFLDTDVTQINLIYELNGGVNSALNPQTLKVEELPFVLNIPARAGYNFAGWYSDCNYQNKVSEITEENAADMVLFAKWTNAINSRFNVEMYSYQTGNVMTKAQKELKECSYGFLDNIEIPGMPSTREKDYVNNIISSANQCMQGLCFTPELILMTAYSEDQKNLGSMLIFDRASGEYLVTLGMKEGSHLGGIAYDGKNIWICHSNSSSLERISYEYILKIAQDAPGYFVNASALSDEYHIRNTPSCITSYGGRIWVATHTKMFNSQMLSYCYNENNDNLTCLSSYNIPSKVQGVAFDEDGAIYLSTSYGRNSSSFLKVYASLLSLDKKPNDPSVKVEMPPCSEEIAVADGNIYVLFESASAKYFEGTDGYGQSPSPIDKVLEVAVTSIW